MKAVRIHAFGGPEVLQLDEVPTPEPGLGELLVRVHAASVNPVDYKIRQGGYPQVKDENLPYAMGRDLAGEVIAVGEGVQDVQPGDAVLAHLGWDNGANAEQALVREGEWARKPEGVSFDEAGALPLAADTAWQGLFAQGELKEGERVLIHGASGGVGHLAVQFAKVRGAYVFATGSAAHLDLLKEIGADVVIDHHAQKFEEIARDIDLVYDLIGGETRERSWGVLKPQGRLVTTVDDGKTVDDGAAHGRRGIAYHAEPRGADLDRIARMVEDGRVRVIVSKTFPLAEVQAAHRAVEDGHTVGKVVLKP